MSKIVMLTVVLEIVMLAIVPKVARMRKVLTSEVPIKLKEVRKTRREEKGNRLREPEPGLLWEIVVFKCWRSKGEGTSKRGRE